MRDPATLGALLALTVVFSLFWGLVLWHFDERSQSFRRWVFFAMGFTRQKPGEVRALLLSLIYYGVGLLATLILAGIFGVPVTAMISWAPAHLALTILGIIGAISLTNLFVDLGCRLPGQGRPEQFAEMKEVPWMKGLREFPRQVVPVAAALGGVVEEVFFRGMLLHILTNKLLVNPLAAVAIAGVLFCLQQLVQVRTAFQALIIGSGCAAISTVGGLLVVTTGSVIPAVVCHASFVIFFMTKDSKASASSDPHQVEVAAR